MSTTARHTASRRALLICMVLLCMTACGVEEPANSTGSTVSQPPRTLQRALSEGDWQTVVDGDKLLTKLVADVGLEFRTAGVIEAGVIEAGVIEAGALEAAAAGTDKGTRLHWAEYAEADAPREQVVALFRRCDGTGTNCIVGKGVHTASGVLLSDHAGKSIPTLNIGRAVLHKVLKNPPDDGHETVLRLPLKRNRIVDRLKADLDMAAMPQGKRRLLILSAHGGAVGVNLDRLVTAVKAAALFDTVELIEFARLQDVRAQLPRMTPQDVVIWFGAGVVQNCPDAASKSVGMTLSRGIFGDELVRDTDIEKLLDAPMLGGPGLVVLAGSNSLTKAHPQQTELMARYLHESTYRPVVGFDGKISVAAAQGAVIALLKSLFSGERLSTAVVAGSAAAQASMTAEASATGATGTTGMTTMLTAERSKLWRLPVKKSEFWGNPPQSARLKLFLKNTPKCVKLPAATVCTEQGFKTGTPVKAELLTASNIAFECDVTFDGPWLSCSANNTATGAKFTLRGVMTGSNTGDYVLLTATGSPSKKVQSISIVAAGLISSRSDVKGTLTLEFDGKAAGSTWTDGVGNCCIAVTPLLSSNLSKPSVLTIRR